MNTSAAPAASQYAKPVLLYSSIGHWLFHLMTAFYATIVLAQAIDWGIDKRNLLDLLWLSVILTGAAAMLAGWLGDRWSTPGIMVVFFIGIGVSSIFCGFADHPVIARILDKQTALFIGLSGIGLFGSIYHPVGIAWVMRTAASPGRALGINGIFGSAGLASAGILSGLLADIWNWRAAFIAPGLIAIAVGIGLLLHWRIGVVGDRPMPASGEKPPSKGDMVKVFFILMVTMVMSGIIYQAVQYALPAYFEARLHGTIETARHFAQANFGKAGEPVFWVGLAVTAVYTSSGVMQYFSGRLADKLPLKTIYTATFIGQIAMLTLIGALFELPTVAAAMAAAIFSVAGLPAEAMLIGRYTPTKYHGLAFGSKFVLAFGAGFLALKMVGWVKDYAGEYGPLFYLLAAAAAVAALAALLLPGGRGDEIAVQAARQAAE